MYRYLFRNVETGQEHLVRARDAAAAIYLVEEKLTGTFDCLAEYSDANGSAEPLRTWEPGQT